MADARRRKVLEVLAVNTFMLCATVALVTYLLGKTIKRLWGARAFDYYTLGVLLVCVADIAWVVLR